jgi:carbon monoxide dehydrogenase subunit G
MKVESKIGKLEYSDEKIYNFLTNFNNFKHLIPVEKVKNWYSDEMSCRFKVDFVGETGVKILEKTPFSLIKLTNIEESKYDFYFWVQLKKLEEEVTGLKLIMEAKLNPMMEMMAKKPLQEFLDKVVDQLSKYKF